MIQGREHTEVHQVAKPIRFKVADRKTITTKAQLDTAIANLVDSTGHNESELRSALYDHLTGQYPKGEFDRNRTEALDAALAYTA